MRVLRLSWLACEGNIDQAHGAAATLSASLHRVQTEQEAYIAEMRQHIQAHCQTEFTKPPPSTTLNMPGRSGPYRIDADGNAVLLDKIHFR